MSGSWPITGQEQSPAEGSGAMRNTRPPCKTHPQPPPHLPPPPQTLQPRRRHTLRHARLDRPMCSNTNRSTQVRALKTPPLGSSTARAELLSQGPPRAGVGVRQAQTSAVEAIEKQLLVDLTVQMRHIEKDVDSQGRVPLLGGAVCRHHRDGLMCSLPPHRPLIPLQQCKSQSVS